MSVQPAIILKLLEHVNLALPVSLMLAMGIPSHMHLPGSCPLLYISPGAESGQLAQLSPALQIVHPQFLRRTLPVLEEQQVRLVHTRPGFDNLSMHSNVFDQVGLPACNKAQFPDSCTALLNTYEHSATVPWWQLLTSVKSVILCSAVATKRYRWCKGTRSLWLCKAAVDRLHMAAFAWCVLVIKYLNVIKYLKNPSRTNQHQVYIHMRYIQKHDWH